MAAYLAVRRPRASWPGAAAENGRWPCSATARWAVAAAGDPRRWLLAIAARFFGCSRSPAPLGALVVGAGDCLGGWAMW